MSGIKNLKNPEKSAEEELDASTWSEDGPLGTLTRQDIALAIFDRCEGLSRREAKRLVDSVIEEMIGTLTQGETLKLHDFGSFIVRSKGERAGRNPRTGAKVPIEPRKVVVFKASPNMKSTVNGEGPAKKRTTFKVVRKSADEGGV
ncbi:MAG: HU family DNA-binding protein [Methylocystis sp.]|jgi:integration host factor subunit alpha